MSPTAALGSLTRLGLPTALGLLAASATAQPSSGPMPGLRALDSVYAVHGIQLGTSEGSVPWLRPATGGLGKRWRSTHLYAAKTDTLTLARQRVRDVTFWFRGGRYIGAMYIVPKEQKSRFVREQLTRRYGPPRTGQEPNTWYWLGRRTYVLYEDAITGQGSTVFVAGLAMLNEQVFETTVRREARAALGWQPDSLGLPRQLDVPAAKKK